jgi:hypothetical protein
MGDAIAESMQKLAVPIGERCQSLPNPIHQGALNR